MLQIPCCAFYDSAEERGGTVATGCMAACSPGSATPLSFPLIQLCGVQGKALLQGEGLFQEVCKNDPGLFSASTIDDSPWIALPRVPSLAWGLAARLQKIFYMHFNIQSFFQNYLL